MKPSLSLLLALASATVVSACSPAPKTAPAVSVSDAWCRATPSGALTGACYLSLAASTDDRLVSISTTAADHGEIHTMDMTDGVMRMRELEGGLALPAGETVALKPGGEHLMIIGPKQPLVAGAAVPLTLVFEKAPAQAISVPVREANAPAAGHQGMH